LISAQGKILRAPTLEMPGTRENINVMFPAIALLAAAFLPLPDAPIAKAFGDRNGALVLIDCASGEIQQFHPKLCATKLAPCSTFKIWNTVIGLETALLTDADQPFWKWDGTKRSIEAWNHDLTLRQAYAASCVPAYQTLARRIGAERMNHWLKKLGYGDEDTSSGIDVFWLPAHDRKPLLVSANEQAQFMYRLTKNDVPFSPKTLTILKDIMTVKTTARGTLYGKTGTSGKDATPEIGWFVGYVVSGKETLAFACLLHGPKAAGKDARTVVEQVLNGQDLL
jgi:beta-lactamase class D